MRYCVICGKPAECTHHLVGGTARRRLSDEDKLCIELCNEHHNLAVHATERIHGNPMAEILSKMLGQAVWERNYLLKNEEELEKARHAFIGRYGRNYL